MAEDGTYSDPRCCTCNPPGWREVDGVQLPPITWGELVPSAFPVKAGDTLVFTIAEQGPKPYHSGRLDVLRKGRAE